MPKKRCTKDGQQGWKWGNSGTCFTGPDALEKVDQARRASHANSACNEKISGLTTNVQTRTEVIHGVNYIVAPVTMIVEGVLPGSQGPIFYGANEISESVQFWNGVPVTINHPQNDGQLVSARSPTMIEQFGVGYIFNSFYDPEKRALKAEAWIQANILQEKYPEVYEMIVDNQANVEVSTGVMFVAHNQEGEFNGVAYNAMALDLNGDHLAILPNAQGACSWSDGCGLRANQKKESENNMKKHDLFYNALSYSEISRTLERHVDSLDTSEYINYAYAIYNDYFIYRQINRATSAEKMFKKSYSVDSNNKVEISDDATEVSEQRNFISINNETRGDEMAKEKPCCPEKVESLIGASNNRFTEKDREFLLSLNETQLESAIAMAEDDEPAAPKAPVEKTAANSEPKTNKEPEKKEQKMTLNEYIDQAPEDIKNFLSSLVSAHNQKKEEMVKTISANENCLFTKEDLKSFSFNHLEKMVDMISKDSEAGGSADMSGAAGGADVTGNESIPTLDAPEIDW